MSATEPKPVTDAELAVLRVLWRGGPATIRALTDELYPAGGSSAYATVQKLLDRLAAKDCVSRQPAGRANVFSPTVGRGDLIARRLQDVADTLCDGALSPLLTHLVDKTRLSDDELATLRRLVADLDDEDGGPR